MGNDEQSETHAEIMEATYRALCEHGYASLTMQNIADELEKSKGLLHYHFDSKEELLIAFIDYLLSEFEQDIASIEGPPDKKLDEFIERFVVVADAGDRQALHLALLELRAQSPFNDRFREHLARSDTIVRDTVAEIVRDGITQGVFRADAEPEVVAQLVLASMDGARTRGLTIGDETYPAAVSEALNKYVIDDILVKTNE
ncbi:TetR/AcrR family transcriptional regulator [Halobacteria archaeon AArc-m2/3/4]|uniref:TetR/AcrR family transcriptional regulator n=1 Tax=Natronoglomus mannanivorans TaxID=2979990 RepID=A0ABT2QGD2_9EURY|nr:TetR/AcrR family transcriptional regulator [Halobacteria archaeon AArc-m2/3/4]MCU4975032.1 TetR/AcrR family transcriptional regulator [Halobacteria archaeon AArc-m2/3/4]